MAQHPAECILRGTMYRHTKWGEKGCLGGIFKEILVF